MSGFSFELELVLVRKVEATAGPVTAGHIDAVRTKYGFQIRHVNLVDAQD